MLVNGKSKYKCYGTDYTELSEKVAVFKKVPPKKSSSFGKVAVPKKYLLRKSTYSK